MVELRDAFEKALELEEKGKLVYAQAASKTANPLVARTFNYLAQQEVRHIKEIKEYLATGTLAAGGDSAAATSDFFTTTVAKFKQKLDLSDDDIKAHETGMELEKNSYDYYKQQYDAVHDKKVKNFFRFLMEQENAHYELIKKSYEFIKDPEAFYAKQEDHFYEGG